MQCAHQQNELLWIIVRIADNDQEPLFRYSRLIPMAKDSNIPAQSSLIKNRNIITQREVKKALLHGDRPVVKPLAKRLVNLQPGTGTLTPLRRGVTYAVELVDSLKVAQPQAQQEKGQYVTRIDDTIHLLEGLRKGIEKEASVQLADGPDQPLYLELTVMLDSVKSSIETLQEMKSADS